MHFHNILRSKTSKHCVVLFVYDLLTVSVCTLNHSYLVLVQVGCTVLLCLIRPSLSLVMSISLAGIYQYLLSHGLQDYILRPGGRDEGFISANREGIFSTIGYMSLYCAGVTVGQLLFRTRWLYFKRTSCARISGSSIPLTTTFPTKWLLMESNYQISRHILCA